MQSWLVKARSGRCEDVGWAHGRARYRPALCSECRVIVRRAVAGARGGSIQPRRGQHGADHQGTCAAADSPGAQGCCGDEVMRVGRAGGGQPRAREQRARGAGPARRRHGRGTRPRRQEEGTPGLSAHMLAGGCGSAALHRGSATGMPSEMSVAAPSFTCLHAWQQQSEATPQKQQEQQQEQARQLLASLRRQALCPVPWRGWYHCAVPPMLPWRGWYHCAVRNRGWGTTSAACAW